MKLTYRPEIDGLRAIAVGAVILYHAKINIFGHQPFEGGFIGVDIFFVISGYLITSIILNELLATNSFSFRYFYERRVRRILPVLLLVMLVSIVFGWMYLLPSSFIDFSKSIIYSIGFSSNFFFHYSGQVYGAENGLYKPFLHTWSLSVEEQFYILFPILLLIIFKYFRKYLLQILIFGFIISLGLAEWTSRNYPSISFYFLHTRSWELLAGSTLAYFEITTGSRSRNKQLSLILPFVGIILIFYSLLFFNDEMFHPSLFTLSPVVGVCLIIWFSDKNEFVTKILSSKIFVGIGLISYSLYLWHFPVFAFARITEFALENTIAKISLIPIVFILSIISYYLIEQPFRNKNNYFKKLIIILIVCILFLVSFNLYIINNSGFKERIPKIFQDDLIKYREDINLNQKNDVQKVVLIGDSHSGALLYNLNEEIKKNNFSLFHFNSFMYLQDFNRINRKTNEISKLSNDEINNFLENNSNLIIVLHYRWSLKILEKFYDNEEGVKEETNLVYESYLEPINIKTLSSQQRQKYIRDGLISQINKILNLGHDLILVYPVPEMGFNVPRLLNSKYIRQRFNSSEFETPILSGSYEVFNKRNKFVFDILDDVKSPNIYRVYPHEFFCNTILKYRCVGNDKNNIFYRDDDHLSLRGSLFVVEEIMNKIKNNNLAN